MIDLNDTEIVELDIRDDGQVVWLNVDGVCRIRINSPGEIIVNDGRPSKLIQCQQYHCAQCLTEFEQAGRQDNVMCPECGYLMVSTP